jgi:hypothetical protein
MPYPNYRSEMLVSKDLANCIDQESQETTSATSAHHQIQRQNHRKEEIGKAR